MDKEFRLRRSARKDSIRVEESLYDSYYKKIPRVFEDIEIEKEFCKIAVDSEGNIIGGCVGDIYAWGVLYVDTLWVSEKYRGKDLGSNLLKAVEDVGREKGCHLSFLGTLDFQARPFYEKHGYKLFGIAKDWPKGHEDYALYKPLDVDVPERGCKPTDYVIRDGTEEEGEYVDDQLGEYNLKFVPKHHDYIKINRKIVDKDGNFVAGIFAGDGWWDTAFIWALWVEEPYRNKGFGTKLLSHFEKQAKAKGAYAVVAEGVFDWSLDFFLKRGYEVFQELHDFPKGHTFYSVKKEL